mmetsp:Transcript_11879/g.20023  ORF Transcript_11879/g.20023 Transcript_11879/m.20023 type:complete len:310 (-) Transcript_11879:188-1117(-)
METTTETETRRPLRNLTIALSAGNATRPNGTAISQRDLGALISNAGGVVSRIVHTRVDMVIATPTALLRGTQAVRKARDKFNIPLVSPAFIFDALEIGALPANQADYTPVAQAPADSASSRPSEGISPVSLGLVQADESKEPKAVEVLVEMDFEPIDQWWPAHFTCMLTASPRHSALACELVYEVLPSRGYDEPSTSKAIIGAKSTNVGGWLWDVYEEVWRAWRLATSTTTAAVTMAPLQPKAETTSMPKPSRIRKHRWYAVYWGRRVTSIWHAFCKRKPHVCQIEVVKHLSPCKTRSRCAPRRATFTL